MQAVRAPSSWRRWWLTWRSRLSVPAMLARSDERRVVSIAAAVSGGVAVLGISAVAWLIDLPLLFPALGPTAFLLFTRPFSVSAAPRSVVVGHLAAMMVGLAVWRLTTLASDEPVSVAIGDWPTLIGAALALAATSVVLVRLSCPHAPACATALIVAMGAADDAVKLAGMAGGVLLLTAQALLIHRIACVNVPGWSGPDDANESA